MALSLRYYQEDAVNAVWRHIREKADNPCVVIPTAGGKSLCIAQIAKDAVQKFHGRVLLLAHVKELIEQNAGKIKAICPELPVGIYSAGLGSKDTAEPIIAAGIQSIYGNGELFRPFDYIIVDECHLIPEKGEGRYRQFLAEMKARNPSLRTIGFTATPFRTHGGMICKPENILNEVCYEISVRELVNKGFISQLMSKAGKIKPDLDNLHMRLGEFVQEDIDAAMGDETIVTNACREIVEYTKNRKACLIFCTSVKHCRRVAELIQLYSGEECAVVTGETSAEDRAATIRRLKGETVEVGLFNEKLPPVRYCCNVSVLTTGTDIPNLDTIALLRPTASAGLFIQMVGRGFRLAPGKTECLVLDYGRNLERFGPIDAIQVCEPQESRRSGKLVKECPECHSLLPLITMKCPDCGFEFEAKEKKPKLDQTASTLSLLSPETTEIEYDVQQVSYHVWRKRGAAEQAPKTVRINYCPNMFSCFSEWLCPEHTGYARRKFVAWWKEHAHKDCPIPVTAEDVIEYESMGMIRRPKKITVRQVQGEKFPTIIKYELGECPIDEKSAEDIENGDDYDDIPF